MNPISKLHDSLFDEVIAVSFYHGTECVGQLVVSEEAEEWDDKGFPSDMLKYLCDIKKQRVQDYQKEIAKAGELTKPAKLVIAADGFTIRALGYPAPVVEVRNSTTANYVESIVFFISSDMVDLSFFLLCDVTLDRFLEPIEFFDDQTLPESVPTTTLDQLFRSLDTSGSRVLTKESFCAQAGAIFTQMRQRDLETAFQDILDRMSHEKLGDEGSKAHVIDYHTFRRFVYGSNGKNTKALKKSTLLLKELCQNCVELSELPEKIVLEDVPWLNGKLRDCERVLQVMERGLVMATEGVSADSIRHWENSALRHRLRIMTYKAIICGCLGTENAKLKKSLEQTKTKEEHMLKLQAEKLDIETKYNELEVAAEEQNKTLTSVNKANESLRKENQVIKGGLTTQIRALDGQVRDRKRENKELRGRIAEMKGKFKAQLETFVQEKTNLEKKLNEAVEHSTELEGELAQAEKRKNSSHEEEMKAFEKKHVEEMKRREEKFKEEFKQERIQVASEWEEERLKMKERVRALEATIDKLKEDTIEQRLQVTEEWKEEREELIVKIKSLEKTVKGGCLKSDGQEKMIVELKQELEQNKLVKERLAQKDTVIIKELKSNEESLKKTIDEKMVQLKESHTSKELLRESFKRTIGSLGDEIKFLKGQLSDSQSRLMKSDKQLHESQSQLKKYEEQLQEAQSQLKEFEEPQENQVEDIDLILNGQQCKIDICDDCQIPELMVESKVVAVKELVGSDSGGKTANSQSLEPVSAEASEIRRLKEELRKQEKSYKKALEVIRKQETSHKKALEGSDSERRSANSNSRESVGTESSEIRRLKAELRKQETSYKKALEAHTSTNEKRLLEERIETLTNENIALDEQLSMTKYELVKLEKTIKEFNSLPIVTNNTIVKPATSLTIVSESPSTPIRQLAAAEDNEDIKETSPVSTRDMQYAANLRRQKTQLSNEIVKLQRKINEEEERLKKSMQRLEIIKTKRRLLHEECSKERYAWKKDKTQREFDLLMERLIERVKDQKTELDNLRRRVLTNTSNRSESTERKTRKEVSQSESGSAPRASSYKDSVMQKQLQLLAMKNDALHKQIYKVVLDVMEDMASCTDVNSRKWRGALQKLETASPVAGAGIESISGTALNLLYSCLEISESQNETI